MTERVLVSAYQCGPGMGSVSQIGWEWYRRLRRRVPTTLVTHVRNRPALEPHVDADADVLFIDTEWFARRLYRLACRIFPTSEHATFLLSSLDFFFYDRLALRAVKQRWQGGERWDIAHVVTPVSPAAPSRLHRLPLPVVRGPLNGGLGQPDGFEEVMESDSGWFYPLRRLGHVLDQVSGSSRGSARILTANATTREALPRHVLGQCEQMSENGVDLDVFPPAEWPSAPDHRRPLKILFVGRLIPCKGLPFLLESVSRHCRLSPAEVTVIGSGPLESEWRQLADGLQLGSAVRFLGQQPPDEVARQMRAHHLLVLPSVRESGGAVLLEAMAAQRPVIAVDFGGPAEIVHEGVGRLISAKSPRLLVAELTDTLADVVANPRSWRERGIRARREVESRYSWDAKIGRALSLYSELVVSAPRHRQLMAVSR